ncbi:hypothetical protein BKA66DRAFT_439223 [Pyrenochaeta sp. MPI-SDFR-AT-0127]|nr:hypothetical protein BKA66DRAFT_439223 [Pyrenochaeta sp. MPI-SDFR-AT-0127]
MAEENEIESKTYPLSDTGLRKDKSRPSPPRKKHHVRHVALSNVHVPHISGPLYVRPGISNDMTTATGSWTVCDPDTSEAAKHVQSERDVDAEVETGNTLDGSTDVGGVRGVGSNEGKTKDCNEKHTFDTFVKEEQLNKDELEGEEGRSSDAMPKTIKGLPQKLRRKVQKTFSSDT